MIALFLAAALAVASPVEASPTEATNKVVETPINRTIRLRHQFLVTPPPAQSTERVIIDRYVPYGEELNELNDWYQRYRADKRWQNGIGITFMLGRRQHRWTIGLGPVQFSFGGKQNPPPR